MADFCWGCTDHITDGQHPDRNDFAGIADPGRYAWLLCEGCGSHRFDNTGRRACTAPSWFDDPEAAIYFGCVECHQEAVAEDINAVLGEAGIAKAASDGIAEVLKAEIARWLREERRRGDVYENALLEARMRWTNTADADRDEFGVWLVNHAVEAHREANARG